jgi:septin family protein
MEMLLPEEVFVTDGFPEHTYVSIDQGKPEKDLREGLEQKNKIISIVGPSKSGKSTLCDSIFGRNIGVDKISVTGGSIASDTELWREAYRQVTDDTEKPFDERAHAEVIEYLIQKDLPLIVDDFHYINRDTQVAVCRQFKNAASVGLRIVILSIPHRGDDPIRSNPDLSGRYFSVDFRW